MLRTTIKKPVTQKEALVLQTNHNYFVRITVTNICKLVLVAIITSIIVYAVAAFLPEIITSIVKLHSYYVGIITVTVILVCLVLYLTYFIVTIYEILSIHKKILKIEEELLGDN